jgi:hypothetical protein
MNEKTNNMKIWRDAVSATADCISMEELHQLLEDTSSHVNRARHVDGCPHCQADLALIKNFESPNPNDEEAAAVAWIVAKLSQTSREAALPFAPPARKNHFWRPPYLLGGVAAALAVVLGVSLFMHYQAGRPVPIVEPSALQTMRSASLYLTAPSGSVLQTPSSFQWESLQGARSYSIEVMEVDGSILWSGQAGANVLVVNPDLAKKLQPNRVFIWKVTARDSSGNVVATSNQERFIIKPANGNKQ